MPLTQLLQKKTGLANKTIFICLSQRVASNIQAIVRDDQQVYFLTMGASVSDPPTHDETKKLILERE
jgi:hypothetical protein